MVVGASNKYTADMQCDQIALYWINVNDGRPTPLTVRILGRDRDVYYDLEGGNRIPKISERQARSVAELRAAGVGADRVFLAHDGTQASSDLFQSVLTVLDPGVALSLVTIPSPSDGEQANHSSTLARDVEEARQVGRELKVHEITADWGPAIVRSAREDGCDLIIVPLPDRGTPGEPADGWRNYL